jgi:integrase
MRKESSQPRRVRVERGIYVRGSDTYEITYTDSDGRQRWKTIDGGLKAARAARGDILAKLHRGERVAPPAKLTLMEVADEWLAAKTRLRPATQAWYSHALEAYIKPLLGRRKIGAINEDDIVRLIATMEQHRSKRLPNGYAAWTIRGTVTVLGGVLGYAARRGLIASNPARKLERGERPSVGRREMRILDRDEIGKLLTAIPALYRTLIATAIFTGLRQGELLGLTWADVDLAAGLLRVRKQLDRSGTRVAPKTPEAVREVVLMPALGKLLKERKEQAFARGHAKPHDFVFTSATGGPMHRRNIVRRGLEKGLEIAKLDGAERPKLRWHDLRHTYASLLVAQGADVVFVSRQIGHASPDITLRIYSHLFDSARHAERTRDALEAAFGHVL